MRQAPPLKREERDPELRDTPTLSRVIMEPWKYAYIFTLRSNMIYNITPLRVVQFRGGSEFPSVPAELEPPLLECP